MTRRPPWEPQRVDASPAKALRKSVRTLNAARVRVGHDGHEIDVFGHGVGQRGHAGRAAGRPCTQARRAVDREPVLNAFSDREAQKIVRGSEHDRRAERAAADDDLVWLDVGLAGSVRLQLDELDRHHRAVGDRQRARLGLGRHAKRRDQRRRMLSAGRKEAERGRNDPGVAARPAQIGLGGGAGSGSPLPPKPPRFGAFAFGVVILPG